MDTLAVTGITVDMLVKWQENGAEEILILDSRPFISYNEGHIVTATNVHCPPILKRRSGGFVALENIVPCTEKREKLEGGDFKRVVVYDEDTVDLELSAKDSNLYSVLKSLRQQIDSIEVDELCYIKGLYLISKLNKLFKIFLHCNLETDPLWAYSVFVHIVQGHEGLLFFKGIQLKSEMDQIMYLIPVYWIHIRYQWYCNKCLCIVNNTAT